MEESDWIFVARILVRFSVSGIIILSISLSEIFGYMLNGLPKTHKATIRGASNHALTSSHLTRWTVFEEVRYNNNHTLKRRFVLNQIIKTSQKVHFFPGN